MKTRKREAIVVSGCSDGLGKKLCELYRARGDVVIGLSRSCTVIAEELSAVDAPSGGCDIKCDVTNAAAVDAAVHKASEIYGGIDAVIACAGGGVSGATELLPPTAVQENMSLNFNGALNTVNAALKHMTSGGRVAVISSVCALFTVPFRTVYCAAKSAVNSACEGLYMELKPHGIRVSAICPGEIKTSFTKNRVKYGEGGDRYGARPKESAQKIDDKEPKRMSVDKAAKKIFGMCNKCKKPCYVMGTKYKILYALKKVVPQKLFLSITAKFF